MGTEFTQNSYQTKKEILMFPDHCVSFAHTFLKDDAAATAENGRKIVKAGTIYPANNGTAKGVVLNDYDVTNGDITGALAVHCFINVPKIPHAPSVTACTVLPQIKFFNAIS